MSDKKIQPPGSMTIPLESLSNKLSLWMGSEDIEIAGILKPLHIDELQEMVLWGGDEKVRFVVYGNGSQGLDLPVSNDRPVWILDLSGIEVPVESFLRSQTFWLPASRCLTEVEGYLSDSGFSLGIWAELFSDCTLGGSMACAAPFVRQSFYQKGPQFVGFEGVSPEGRRFQTAEAPRVATGFRADLLWLGTRGQVGPLTRVLLSVSAASREQHRYLVRTDTLAEATALALDLVRSEYTPELAFCSVDNRGPYLFWSQKVTNTRDYLFGDYIMQVADSRLAQDQDCALQRFREVYAAAGSDRKSIGYRWNELETVLPSLQKRKKGWIIRLAGRHGWTLEMIRPWPREFQFNGGDSLTIIEELIQVVDPFGLFHEVQR